MSFDKNSAGTFEAKRLKPSFIRIANGIEASSATPGIALEDGDVNLRRRALGFVSWDLSEAAANRLGTSELHYYVHNNTTDWIYKVEGIDKFQLICEPRQHVHYAQINNGDVLYIGNKDNILPQVEITEINNGVLKATYCTVFKESISDMRLTVIGMGYKDNNSGSESTLFPSRVVGETKDGWLLEVDIPKNAVPNNTLSFQVSYNGDKDVSTQVKKEVQL